MPSGTRVLMVLMATHGDMKCADLASVVGGLKERASTCKIKRPSGGYAAFMEEEMSEIDGRPASERSIILTVLSRHSTRSGVIAEMTTAHDFLIGGDQEDSLAKAIGDTYRKIAKKKEVPSRLKALGYADVLPDDNDD